MLAKASDVEVQAAASELRVFTAWTGPRQVSCSYAMSDAGIRRLYLNQGKVYLGFRPRGQGRDSVTAPQFVWGVVCSFFVDLLDFSFQEGFDFEMLPTHRWILSPEVV